MSTGKLTTNLGDQAQSQRLVATSVSSLNYQQPFLQLGTFAVPLVAALTTTIAFDANYSKYVLYMAAPATTVIIANIFTISGAPVDYVSTHTITGSSEWILTGATPTVANVPILDSYLSVLNDTVAPNISSSFTLASFSTAAGAVFSSGSPILKIVININLD